MLSLWVLAMSGFVEGGIFRAEACLLLALLREASFVPRLRGGGVLASFVLVGCCLNLLCRVFSLL